MQVCNQTPPIGDKPSLMTFRVRCAVLQHPSPLVLQTCQIATCMNLPEELRVLMSQPMAGGRGLSHGTTARAKLPVAGVLQEVETLFHEFGHALQHMLTTVEEGLVSGIRGVEWDAVRAQT